MANEPWHLKKEIPITLLVVLLVQGCGFFYWGGQMAKQIEQQGVAIAEQGHKIEAREAWERDDQLTHNKVDSRLAVLETQNATLIAALQRIEDKLDGIPRRK